MEAFHLNGSLMRIRHVRKQSTCRVSLATPCKRDMGTRADRIGKQERSSRYPQRQALVLMIILPKANQEDSKRPAVACQDSHQDFLEARWPACESGMLWYKQLVVWKKCLYITVLYRYLSTC